MEFFKSAVASAISKGPPFPYSFGDKVDIEDSIWTLHNGTKREDGSNCSILSFDITANKSRLSLARNGVKKLRTLRHPGVLKVLDTVETETYIYVAIERVIPVSWPIRRKSLTAETIKWGLYNVSKTLKFINEEASSVHGNIRISSVFTSESGEWKLGGFEVLSSLKDEDAIIFTYGSLLPESRRYLPPEVAKSGWDIIKRYPITAPDAYTYGKLIYEVFNGDLAGVDTAGQVKNVPAGMQQSYKRLMNPNPAVRLSVGHFLEQGLRRGGFFETPLIKLTEGIENLGLKSEHERGRFLSELDSVTEDFPEDFLKVKVLPELLKSIEFGGGGPPVFSIVMKLSGKLSEDEYEALVTPVIVRLFASPDRAMRVCLLDNLPLMIEHLPQKIVNEKIFPQMVSGFTDVAPIVREQTVKGVLTVITKLSDRTVNGELLKYLAKTSNDDQPGIRTNTTICLGKIARNLGANTRQKVLAAAFTRSLRDPFVHARNAALMALAATSDVFSDEDCAVRLLPALCPSLIDKEKIVRDQANKTFDIYLSKTRKYGATLPDTALPPAGSADATTSGGVSAPRMGLPQTDKSWSGWAISSFTNKLASARGEIQPRAAAEQPQLEANGAGPMSAPHTAETGRFPSEASAPALPKQPATVPVQSTIGSTNNVDYFDDAGFIDDEMDAWNAKGDFEDSKPKSAEPEHKVVAYDDAGEPDFAGWLSAQANAKAKRPLPKGLTKKLDSAVPNRGVTGRSATTGSIEKASKRSSVVPVVTKQPAVVKQVDTKPKEDNEEDGWGDGWD